MSFAVRIETILSHYHLSPKELAEKLGVQRSSISHIITGRNKPSVAFITKLSDAFPELNTAWILHGSDPMITDVSEPKGNSTKNESNISQGVDSQTNDAVTNVFSGDFDQQRSDSFRPKNTKQIRQVITFYTDGTFDIYYPSAE